MKAKIDERVTYSSLHSLPVESAVLEASVGAHVQTVAREFGTNPQTGWWC